MKFAIAIFSTCLIIVFNSSTLSAQGVVRDFDGNEYKTVKIKDQTWMAENLRSIHDAQGKKIKRYCYLLIRENCEKYGGLYSWNELQVNVQEDSLQGICPNGWHIPSDKEWSILIQNLGGADSAAYILNQDTAIFGIQFGGNYHYRLKNYNYLNDIAYYWTSTPFSRTASWMRMIGRLNFNSNRSTVPNVYGLSVRCIKD